MLTEATVVQDIFDKLIEETGESVIDYQLQYAHLPEKIVYYDQNPVFIGYGYDSKTQKVVQINEPVLSDSSSEIHPIYYCYHIEPIETARTHKQLYGMMIRMRDIKKSKDYLKSDPVIIDIWPDFYINNPYLTDAWQKHTRIMVDLSHEYQHVYDWYVSSSEDIRKVITIQDIGYTNITEEFFIKHGIYFLEDSDIEVIGKVMYLFSVLETNAINKQIESFIRLKSQNIIEFFNSKPIYRKFNNKMLTAEFVNRYVVDANIGFKAYQNIIGLLESSVKNNSYVLLFALMTAMVAHKFFEKHKDICELFEDFTLCEKAYSGNVEMTSEIHYAIETVMNEIRDKFEDYYSGIMETTEIYLKRYGCFNIPHRRVNENILWPTMNSHMYILNEQKKSNLITDSEMWHAMNVELLRICSDVNFSR